MTSGDSDLIEVTDVYEDLADIISGDIPRDHRQ